MAHSGFRTTRDLKVIQTTFASLALCVYINIDTNIDWEAERRLQTRMHFHLDQCDYISQPHFTLIWNYHYF
jgi:hypothetical protein